MIEFRCINCGVVISIDAPAPGEEITCYGCDTTQPIPANARTNSADIGATGSALEPEPFSISAAPKAPEYMFTGFVAGSLVVLGIIGSVLFLCMFIGGSGSPTEVGIIFGSFFACIFMVAFGALLFCIRDIAINTWHQNNLKR